MPLFTSFLTAVLFWACVLLAFMTCMWLLMGYPVVALITVLITAVMTCLYLHAHALDQRLRKK